MTALVWIAVTIGSIAVIICVATLVLILGLACAVVFGQSNKKKDW